MSDAAIRHAIQTGRMHRVFRGVYSYGLAPVGERARTMAAVLACGDGAVVSHRSTAAMLGLLDRAPTLVDVIASEMRGRKIEGIRVHLVPTPPAHETGTIDGIPCTNPARTLVDLAGTVGNRTLRSCFERAAARRMLDLGAIEASMAPGRRGMPNLRALVQEWRLALPTSTQPLLKSPLEAMVLPLLARRGVPAPRSNARVPLTGNRRIEVDFLWAEQRFVLEADSRDFHGTEVAFERDRWRDRELMRVGHSSLRVTRLHAENETEAVAEAVVVRLMEAGLVIAR